MNFAQKIKSNDFIIIKYKVYFSEYNLFFTFLFNF